MPRLPHLLLQRTATTDRYVSPSAGRGTFKTPPRDSREDHGSHLLDQLSTAAAEAKSRTADEVDIEPVGVPIEFVSDPGFKLRLESLEHERKGIHLLNVRLEGDVMRATVFVPLGQLRHFEEVFHEYIEKDTGKGLPRHQPLVESISVLRLAALRSYWTDTPSLFPREHQEVWWEIWLRGDDDSVKRRFRAAAADVGLALFDQWVTFPERSVVLVFGSATRLSGSIAIVEELAELRLAKIVPTPFLAMSPKEQAELIRNIAARTRHTATRASVCLLDTGINRSHPLLVNATDERLIQSIDPALSPADLNGHGTEMAGISLYGCLTEIIAHDEPIELRHRIESVKILPDTGQNEPSMYGAITAEASARAEIAAPLTDRVFCLAITADSRDDGRPSSWSAELDQLAAGVPDAVRRLFVVAAGNVDLARRHEYPEINQLQGIQDPAQAWNVVTVGAYTERVHISSPDYTGWQPIAQHGRLSPCSTTSLVWPEREWAFKPDIILEGGNSGLDPLTGRADFVDDLALLSVRMSATGALLSPTGETSAAAAQAARLGATIRSYYSQLWPETVRALMVHAAEWTPQMLAEFPYEQREQRLRCYGYGVPTIERALWSAGNAATLVVQSELQPFDRIDGKMTTKEMHVHEIPWPTAVLQSLGHELVAMRVTLSYFIEPSPGRRGWDRKHRYQSHGLRFEVRRPTETLDDLRQRVTRTAWEEPSDRPAFPRDDRNWQIGPRLRTHGSIHSDEWTGTASELSVCNHIAVYPVTGWWRERPHLKRWSRSARYALIVTLKTARTEVDLYTPIRAQVEVIPEIEI